MNATTQIYERLRHLAQFDDPDASLALFAKARRRGDEALLRRTCISALEAGNTEALPWVVEEARTYLEEAPERVKRIALACLRFGPALDLSKVGWLWIDAIHQIDRSHNWDRPFFRGDAPDHNYTRLQGLFALERREELRWVYELAKLYKDPVLAARAFYMRDYDRDLIYGFLRERWKDTSKQVWVEPHMRGGREVQGHWRGQPNTEHVSIVVAYAIMRDIPSVAPWAAVLEGHWWGWDVNRSNHYRLRVKKIVPAVLADLDAADNQEFVIPELAYYHEVPFPLEDPSARHTQLVMPLLHLGQQQATIERQAREDALNREARAMQRFRLLEVREDLFEFYRGRYSDE